MQLMKVSCAVQQQIPQKKTQSCAKLFCGCVLRALSAIFAVGISPQPVSAVKCPTESFQV